LLIGNILLIISVLEAIFAFESQSATYLLNEYYIVLV